MNIHEYQAKQILAQYGINVPAGGIAYTPTEAKRVAQKISARGPWMLKAQIQAGARQSGHFIGNSTNPKGGIRQVTQIRNLSYEAAQMLNNTLITEQTGPQGKLVSKVYVEAFKQVKRLFYAGLIIDSSIPAIVLLISEVVNRDMLAIGEISQDKILRLPLVYDKPIADAQIKRILDFLSLDISYDEGFREFLNKLRVTFINLDAQMIEINPVGIMRNKKLIALDAKINFDDNAMFRHPDILRMQDDYEEDPRYLKAQRYGFHYSELDGNIGCIVNGDGLALETIDVMRTKNYSAACALNVKGGVDKERIAAGIKIIMTNPRVEGVLINILGGFLRCNLVAEGIITATQEVGLNVPMVVRLEGTNKEEAKVILNESKLPIIYADNTNDAIDKLIAEMEVND
jgi:succinyl-CoA synthetase beta subunit